MSLISDALKKAELQRPAPVPLRAAGWDRSVSDPAEPQPAAARRSPRGLFLANLAVLVVLSVAAVYFLRNGPVSIVSGSPRVAAADADESEMSSAVETPAALSAPVENRAPVQRISASPFQPVSTVAATPPVSDDYALDGISALGANTLLSVVRRSDRRSVWIPVGKTVGEVTAVSYDPETDQAVIRVRGELVSISMREAAPSPDTETAPAE